MRLAKAARQNPRKLAEARQVRAAGAPRRRQGRDRGRGLHQFLPRRTHAYHAEIGRILDPGRRLRPLRLRAGRSRARGIRLGEPHRAAARRTRPARRLRRERGESARGRGLSRGARVLRQRCRAGRWKFSPPAPGCATSSNAASGSSFPPTATAAIISLAIAAELVRGRGHGARQAAPAEIFAGPAARRAAGRRQGRLHRRGHRARARAARAMRLSAACSIMRSVAILGDIREDLEEFGVTFDSWFSERSLIDDGSIDRAVATLEAARPRLPQGRRALVQEHGLRRREGPGDGARERHQDLLRLRHRLRVQQARARLRAPALRLGRRSPRLHRAAARRAHRARRSARMLRGAPRAVRHAVPRRREGADVDALGRVRDLAGLARGSRQRCRAPVLRHAQQRSASRFRPGARQGPLQRQPGVLHPVRARARREREAPDAGARPRARCRARRSLRSRSSSSRRRSG